MARPHKEQRISIKIDGGMYADFQHWCAENGVSVSSCLRAFIKRTLDEDKDRKLHIAEIEAKLKGA